MKNIIISMLIGLLFLSPSFASEEAKPGDKIIITEDVEENITELEVSNPPEKNPQKASPQESENNPKEDKTTRESSPKEEKPSEDKGQTDLKSQQKMVDDLVNKLDENSRLVKTLSDLNKGEEEKSPKVKKETENIIKDYKEKIGKASSKEEKTKLENEAADKIRSVSRQNNKENLEDKNETSNFSEGPEEDFSKEEELKKDKLVIEVKSDDEKDKSRNKVYVENIDKKPQSDEPKLRPIYLLPAFILIAIVVGVGFIIYKNDKKSN